LDRTLAAPVEQSRALVITQLHPLDTAAARIVDHQEDSLVAGIKAVHGALQLAAVLRRVALVRLPVVSGLAARIARCTTRADAAGKQQQSAGGEQKCDAADRMAHGMAPVRRSPTYASTAREHEVIGPVARRRAFPPAAHP